MLAFPEPPHRRRRRRLLLGALIAAVLTAAFFAVLIFTPLLATRTIIVEGHSLLPEETAQAALAPLEGRPLTLITDDQVRELLADRPEVAEVTAAAEPPSTLRVEITERVPVAVLQQEGEYVLIDREGRRLSAVADRAAAKLPLIDGGSDAVDSSVFATVTEVLAALPPEVLQQLDHASAPTVDSVELRLLNGRTVLWGSAEANAAKARALQALLGMPEQDPPVKTYDVTAPNRPAVR